MRPAISSFGWQCVPRSLLVDGSVFPPPPLGWCNMCCLMVLFFSSCFGVVVPPPLSCWVAFRPGEKGTKKSQRHRMNVREEDREKKRTEQDKHQIPEYKCQKERNKKTRKEHTKNNKTGNTLRNTHGADKQNNPPSKKCLRVQLNKC